MSAQQQVPGLDPTAGRAADLAVLVINLFDGHTAAETLAALSVATAVAIATSTQEPEMASQMLLKQYRGMQAVWIDLHQASSRPVH